ncbi:hypothetical protein Dcar01_01298 [Deinococcus carri]|uniref:Uncharacterized protein n=1 Tax=Deinococcus carri TaxID=1211323 RepID=A0ABP9W5D9_9DEIO
MTRVPLVPALPVPPLPCPRGPEVFGLLMVEAITPDGRATAPALADWEVRAWPVARLGDATLEARPRRPHLGAAELDHDLRRAGYTPLGPFRTARSQVTRRS